MNDIKTKWTLDDYCGRDAVGIYALNRYGGHEDEINKRWEKEYPNELIDNKHWSDGYQLPNKSQRIWRRNDVWLHLIVYPFRIAWYILSGPIRFYSDVLILLGINTKIKHERVVSQASVAGPADDGHEGGGEQAELVVILKETGTRKISVIKVVCKITGLGLKDAKAAVEQTPGSFAISARDKDEAMFYKSRLEEAGASVTVKRQCDGSILGDHANEEDEEAEVLDDANEEATYYYSLKKLERNWPLMARNVFPETFEPGPYLQYHQEIRKYKRTRFCWWLALMIIMLNPLSGFMTSLLIWIGVSTPIIYFYSRKIRRVEKKALKKYLEFLPEYEEVLLKEAQRKMEERIRYNRSSCDRGDGNSQFICSKCNKTCTNGRNKDKGQYECLRCDMKLGNCCGYYKCTKCGGPVITRRWTGSRWYKK